MSFEEERVTATFMYKLNYALLNFVSYPWIYLLSLGIYSAPYEPRREKYENAAKFLQLRLPSKFKNRHENGTLRKRSSNGSSLKMMVLRLIFTGRKTF